MGKPAARLTDQHICPAVTGVVPHVGGPIISPCSRTVFVGGLPAARQSDMLVCTGPLDAIVQGSATVFIEGLPAARIGDATAHGGIIITGLTTVLIGDDFAFSQNTVPAAPATSHKNLVKAAGDPTNEPLIASSPVLTRQIKELKAKNWAFRYTPSGRTGSYTSRDTQPKTIFIDPNDKPKEKVAALAHEVGHANNIVVYDNSSRQAYIESGLKDEGAAVINNEIVRNDIINHTRSADSNAIDIGVRGDHSAEYDELYNQYYKDRDYEKAKYNIGQAMRDEKTSTTDQTYEDFYGSSFDKTVKSNNK